MNNAFKLALIVAIVSVAAFVILSSDSDASSAFSEIFARVLLLAGLTIAAVRSYRQRKAKGLSEEQLLMERAGSADELLTQTNFNLWYVRLLLLSPILAFGMIAWKTSIEVALQVALMIALPAWPVGLWAYFYQSRIKSFAKDELQKSTRPIRNNPYAK